MGDNFRTRRKPFTKDYDAYIDYKDLETLSKALSPQGKILSRKRTGADAKLQHKLRRAILKARYMALLPYGS